MQTESILVAISSRAAAFHWVGSTFDDGAGLLAEVDVRGQSARNNRL
jgi:hypothetical protein